MNSTNKQAIETLIRIQAQRLAGEQVDAATQQLAKDCARQIAPEGYELESDLVRWALGTGPSWRGPSFYVPMIADNSAQLDCLVELVHPLGARSYEHAPYAIGLEIGTPDTWDLSDAAALDEALEYITYDGSYTAYYATSDDMRVYDRQSECIWEYQIEELMRPHSAEWAGLVSDAFYAAHHALDGYEECRGFEDYKLGTYGGDNAAIYAHMLSALRTDEKAFKDAVQADDLDLDAVSDWLDEWCN